MEQTAHVKFWHKVVAFIVGYVAAGMAYVVLEQFLAFGYVFLSSKSGSSAFSAADARSFIRFAAGVLAIYVWVKTYKYCTMNWWKPKDE